VTDGKRFELPEGLSSEEERLVLASLERYFRTESPHVPAWALAGRMEQTGHGTLHARRVADHAWVLPGRAPFGRQGGTQALPGRGDAR
jgi:hypothetical protein